MHEKRKKYYHIRKDLFWCTILLAVSFLIGYAIHQYHGIFLTHSLKADAPKERIEIKSERYLYMLFMWKF